MPYIRSLPQDFSTLPLWREVTKDRSWLKILDARLLPTGLAAKTEDVNKRFESDWSATREYWVSRTCLHSDRTALNSAVLPTRICIGQMRCLAWLSFRALPWRITCGHGCAVRCMLPPVY